MSSPGVPQGKVYGFSWALGHYLYVEIWNRSVLKLSI